MSHEPQDKYSNLTEFDKRVRKVAALALVPATILAVPESLVESKLDSLNHYLNRNKEEPVVEIAENPKYRNLEKYLVF